MRIAGSVHRLAAMGGVEVTPVQTVDMMGNTITSDYAVTDIPGPTTDTFPSPTIQSFDSSGTGQQYAAAAAALPGRMFSDLGKLLPTVPWWVWVGGAAALYLVVRKALK